VWFQKISISTPGVVIGIPIRSSSEGVKSQNFYWNIGTKTEGIGGGGSNHGGMHIFWKNSTQCVQSKSRSNEIMVS